MKHGFDENKPEMRKPLTLEDLKGIYQEISKGYAELSPRDDGRVLYVYKKIQSLVEMKDRFQHVFTTDQGSHYFVLASGESLRIKTKSDFMPIQPIMKRIVFITDVESRRLMDLTTIDNITITTTSYGVGVHPFEFGIMEYPESAIEEAGDTIKMVNFSSGMHPGNKIVKIIK